MRGKAADPRWGQAVPLYYRNYRGEVARRVVVPLGLRFAATDHHPEPRWLLEVFDLGKLACRSYALKDCDFAGALEDGRVPPISVKATRDDRPPYLTRPPYIRSGTG